MYHVLLRSNIKFTIRNENVSAFFHLHLYLQGKTGKNQLTIEIY